MKLVLQILEEGKRFELKRLAFFGWDKKISRLTYIVEVERMFLKESKYLKREYESKENK